MAVVVVAADGTAPPPPPPLARGRSRLALAVGDAVLFLCLAKLWLFVAAKTAVDLGCVVACGEGRCLFVSVAAAVVSVCDWFTLETFGAILLVFLSRAEDAASEEQVPVGRKLEEAGREVMPALTAMTIGIIFLLSIGVVGDLLEAYSPGKGSAMERIGSAFSVAWILGKDALCCFIFVPVIAVRLWRVTRPGWRCSAAAAEIKNP
ncbi:unnamed protein product [Urochloa decumbens]|uniref:Uncharacterized protein n=1 Tax=Urochloa decumbens TaxID=240449 RepID=A0ABC9C0T2_9POAL